MLRLLSGDSPVEAEFRSRERCGERPAERDAAHGAGDHDGDDEVGEAEPVGGLRQEGVFAAGLDEGAVHPVDPLDQAR